MSFDARSAKLLQPGSHLTIAPGLRLEATASRRAWVYRFKSPATGLMKQTKIGEWPAMSPAAATAEWEKLRARRDAGEEPTSERAAKPKVGTITVDAVCKLYLEGHVERNRKLKGAKEIRRMFDTMLGDTANLKAEAVTRAEAFDLINRHAEIPVQAAKLKSELAAAWDYALDAGRLPANAFNWWRQVMRGRLKSKGKKIEGKRVPGKRVLSADELGALIRWLPNFSRLAEDALTMYLWTGTRGAEIMAMEAHEVKEEAGQLWWTIPKEKTKNARHANATDLRVPLFGRAAAVARRRIDAHKAGYLFPSTGAMGYSEQKTIGVAVHYLQPYSRTRPEDIRARLPVTHWGPHDLRRSARTLLSSMGCPQELGEAVLGHMPTGVAGAYDRHRYDEERVEWLQRLDVRLEELAAARPSSLAAEAPTPASTGPSPQPRSAARPRAARTVPAA